MKKIVVLGGAVIDLSFRVQALPKLREAVQAVAFQMYPGGKGLNQAVAAARLGAEVSLISAIGDDEFGKLVIKFLELEKVKHSHVKEIPGAHTDVTDVFVDLASGEPAYVGWKSIMLTAVDRDLVSEAEPLIEEADAILITLEVSLEAVEEAIHIARNHKTKVILKPSPPPETALSTLMLQEVDVLVCNLWEAEELLRTRLPIEGDQQKRAESYAMTLHKMGIDLVCVTTSELGCVVASEKEVKSYEAFIANPVDTTGGSDAFCAALAISLVDENMTLEDALSRANAAGAIAVGTFGGAPSMPTTELIDRFIDIRANLRDVSD